MRKDIRVLPILLILSCTNAGTEKNEDEWVSIWNGKDLTGWNTYFNSPFSGFDKTQEGYLGLNNPTQGAIEVVQLEDGNVIRISGTAFGMMSTVQDYGNYHLKLKFKWGKDKHVPKEKEPMDSGLLYHGFGQPGSSYTWMHSHEFQIQEGYTGDYVAIGDIRVDVPSKPTNSKFYQYDENSTLRTYYGAQLFKDDRQSEYAKEGLMDSLAKMNVTKYPEKENKTGAWNEIDLICLRDSSTHMVNGTVVMRLFNSKKTSDKSPLRSGRIGLQSEGAEVYYKDVKLKRINKMTEL
jgi:hypothetical protein